MRLENKRTTGLGWGGAGLSTGETFPQLPTACSLIEVIAYQKSGVSKVPKNSMTVIDQHKH